MAIKSLDEIHDMIATAQAGDTDRILDICQALLEKLRAQERAIEILDETKAHRSYQPSATHRHYDGGL